jgi:hypothetical protein
MDNIATIRNQIGDNPKVEVERYIGDGVITAFVIHGKNPYEFAVTINEVDETGFEFDSEISKLLFDTAPDVDAAIVIKYKSAAFTDEELQAILTASNNDVDVATAAALRQALGDQARMVSFQHGDRSVSMSDIFKNLMSLLNYYEKRVTNEGANVGASFIIGERTMNDKKKGYRPEDLSRLFE